MWPLGHNCLYIYVVCIIRASLVPAVQCTMHRAIFFRSELVYLIIQVN